MTGKKVFRCFYQKCKKEYSVEAILSSFGEEFAKEGYCSPQCHADDMAEGKIPKYGRDFGERITPRMIVQRLRELPDHDAFCDWLDEEFFGGCWPDSFFADGIPEEFKKDIRGILHAALHNTDQPTETGENMEKHEYEGRIYQETGERRLPKVGEMYFWKDNGAVYTQEKTGGLPCNMRCKCAVPIVEPVPNMWVCKRKGCDTEYSVDELIRTLGKEFSEKGYCSPQCLTKDMVARERLATRAEGKANTVPQAPAPLPTPDTLKPKSADTDKETIPLLLEAGKYYRTRDGRKARVICTDKRSNIQHPVISLVENENIEDVLQMSINGRYKCDARDHDYDLITKWEVPCAPKATTYIPPSSTRRIVKPKAPEPEPIKMDKVEVALADKVHEDSKDPIAKALMSFLGKTVHITSGGQKIMGVLQARFDGDWDIFAVEQRHTDDESGIETTRSFSFEANDVSLLNLVRENGAYTPSLRCSLAVKKS